MCGKFLISTSEDMNEIKYFRMKTKKKKLKIYIRLSLFDLRHLVCKLNCTQNKRHTQQKNKIPLNSTQQF